MLFFKKKVILINNKPSESCAEVHVLLPYYIVPRYRVAQIVVLLPEKQKYLLNLKRCHSSAKVCLP